MLAEDGAPPGLRPEAVRDLASGPLGPSGPFNDLTVPAMRAAPELRAMMDRISVLAERPVHLTGSGAGLFVVCDEPVHAEALAAAIREETGAPALAVNAVGGTDPRPAGD